MTFTGSQQGQAWSYADHTFKGSHNFAFQGHCFGKLHRIRRGPWGIQTWQINIIHNIGLYDPMVQIKKKNQQNHFMRKNWFKSLTLKCCTMTTHKFGGGPCTKVWAVPHRKAFEYIVGAKCIVSTSLLSYKQILLRICEVGMYTQGRWI